MVYVIGSGPAAISCASALLDRGVDFTMLDAGIELEPDRQQALTELASQPPQTWKGSKIDLLRHGAQADHKGVGTKHVYGSDFPYQEVDRWMPLQKFGADTTASLARGGFSNVWGSVMLPYVQRDLADWPITADDLAPHYRAVLKWVDLSAVHDDLETQFPLFSERPDGLRPSRQASALLGDLAKSREELHRAGLFFGSSRIAVRASAANGKPGCVYCGLCLYGCPYELIYNSAATLQSLIDQRHLKYRPNVIVTGLRETAGGVEISATDRLTNQPISFQADRVYVACGPVATTRLMLRSLEAYGKPVDLQDSHYYLLPLLRYRSAGRVLDESLHTLCQAFIEIIDPAVCAQTVHLQVYTFNDFYLAAIRKMLGPAFGPLRFAADAVLRRLLIFQGYLHSNYSPKLRCTLERGQGGSADVMKIENVPNDATQALMDRVVGKLRGHRRQLHAMPLRKMMHRTNPGRGFHSGGSFPMSSQPRGFQTDLLGRPVGFRRVHLVDSTVFPTIPATTITLSVMANAHRIGSTHVQD